MNVLLVDTSVWISFFRGQHHPDLELGLKEGRVLLSPVVAAELMSGTHAALELKRLEELIKELRLFETPLDHWLRVGRLRRDVARHGLKVSTPDAHIAQCALDVDGYLLSEDQIFSKIAQHVPLKILR